MSVVGIEIGYQSSLVAAPIGGGIDVLLNEYSQRSTASLVSFGEKQRILGESARLKQVTHFKNTIGSMKRLIGRRYDDPEVQTELSRVFFTTQPLEDGTVGVVCQVYGEQQVLSITQIYAMLLVQLKKVAHMKSGAPNKQVDCVIAVPCYYNDFQRRAVLDASRIAGLNCMRLMSETAAVALTYGIYKSDLPAENETPRRVVFVDFGHSSLQISACDFVKGKVTVLATACDRTLGGRDFDLALFDYFAQDILNKYKLDVRSNPRACIRLEVECEKIKKQMSLTAGKVTLSIECFMNDKDVKSEICREDFEKLSSHLLARVEATASSVVQTLQAQGIALSDVTAVEVVGGSTRVAAVRSRLAQVFQKDVSTTLNLDEAVVRGAALQSAISSPAFRVRDFAVVDKTIFGIDLNWKAVASEEESSANVYAEGSAANLSKVLTFYRDSPFEIEARYAHPHHVPDNESLFARATVEGVSADAQGKAQKIKVKVRLDDSGVFVFDSAQLIEKLPDATDESASPTDAGTASTTDTPTDKPEDKTDKKKKAHKTIALSITTTHPRELTPAQLTDLVELEGKHDALDKQETDRVNAKNALEEYVYDLRNKLDTYAEYFDEESTATLNSKQEEIQNWLYDDGEDQPRQEYTSRLKSMTDISEPALKRVKEHEELPVAEDALRQAIVHFRKITAEYEAGSDKYAHIEPADIAKVNAAVAEKEHFLDEKMGVQRALRKSQALVVTASVLNEQKVALERLCNPIINKPKPVAPPPTAAEPKETDSVTQDTATDTTGAAPQPAENDLD